MPENSEKIEKNEEIKPITENSSHQSAENAIGQNAVNAPLPVNIPENITPAPANNEEQEGLLGRALSHPKAPWVFVGVAAVLVGYWLHTKNYFSFALPGTSPRVVVFDPVKFMNAQRAAVSIMALRPNGDTAFVITQVAKQAEAVILEEARGAVVLVKQAVVVPGSIEDITDKVLIRFDLPVDVPTVSLNLPETMLNVAPTDYSFSNEEASDNYKEELLRRREAVAEKLSGESAQKGAVP